MNESRISTPKKSKNLKSELNIEVFNDDMFGDHDKSATFFLNES